jgi:hypothetical protein
METSKHLSEAISLGKKLIEEFSNEDTRNITTRWMSHYLAELILKIEEEEEITKKKKLQRECVDVILGLWSRRESFPRGAAPLSKLSTILDIFKSLGEDKNEDLLWRKFGRYENDSPWGKYVSKLRSNFEDSFSLVLCGAACFELLDKEKEWLNHATFLSDNEKNILKHLEHLLTKGDGPFKIVYEDAKTNANQNLTPKIEDVLERLDSLLKSQQKELDVLRTKILPHH